MQPQFRVFAGPDGSGKSHLINSLRNQGYVYKDIIINSQVFEKKIAKKMQFNFNAYRVKVSQDDFLTHLRLTGLVNQVKNTPFLKKLNFRLGILHLNMSKNLLNDHIASCVSSYLAVRLLETKQSVTYETDLTHPHIFSLLKNAQKKGYNTSLFYVCTDSSQLNIERMRFRAQAKKEKPDINPQKARAHYAKSLTNFKSVAGMSNHTFIIDNSKSYELVAELANGKAKSVSSAYPSWLKKYYQPRKR